MLGLLALFGFAGGAALWAATDLLSRSDILSLRGNGALIVPFTGGPALLAAGWSLLGLWRRGNHFWAVGGLLAGGAALVLALVVGFLPLAMQGLSLTGRVLDIVLVSSLVAVVPAALLLAYAASARRSAPGPRRPVDWTVAGYAVLPVALLAGLFLPQRATSDIAASAGRARAGHTATLLPSGTVLVAGGNGDYGSLSSAALYDPATGQWVMSGSMAIPRSGHTATPLATGAVLVVGGAGSDAPASAELYDASSSSWTAARSLTQVRFGHAANLLPGGAVLVVGGGGPSDVFAVGELYDPGARAWTRAPTTSGVQAPVAALLVLPEAQILVLGHQMGAPAAAVYDLASGTWSAVPAPRELQAIFTATLLPTGRVLALGRGLRGQVAAAEVFNPGSGTWSETGRMLTPRYDYDAGVLLPDGRVLVAGGNALADTREPRGIPVASAELYDPATGAWTLTGDMTEPRVHHSMTLLPNGKVLAAGGAGRTGPLASAEIYDPATGAWTPTGRMDGR